MEAEEKSLKLTVFQASPLAYGNFPIPFMDLEEEEDILKDALLKGKNSHKIDVSFEIATAHELSTFLAQGKSFLHLSCHGHPNQLFIEDGYGGCHILVVGENLKGWINAGGHSLEFVFVSACHSRSAGQAFIDAGVPYVICCEHNGYQLLDQGAQVFAREFYSALAEKRNQETTAGRVQAAFELARMSVIQSPELRRVAGIKPEVEANKLVLLTQADKTKEEDIASNNNNGTCNDNGSKAPSATTNPASTTNGDEKEEDEETKQESGMAAAYQQQLERKTLVEGEKLMKRTSSSSSQSMSILPIPPKPFLERELDMHNILKAFFVDKRKVRLFRITGAKGIGKVSLAKAIAQYIKKRNMWGEMLWLPPLQRDMEDSMSPASMFNMILEDYHEEKAVLIIDTTHFSDPSMEALCSFLDDAFDRTKYLKVIVIERPDSSHRIQSRKHAAGFQCYEDSVELLPLSFEAAVFLLCHACALKGSGYGGMQRILKRKGDFNTWIVLGKGNPTWIRLLARKITEDEFNKLKGTGPIELSDFEESLKFVHDKMAAEPKLDTPTQSNGDGQVNIDKLVIKDSSTRHKPPPLRTQEEIIDRFVPMFHEEQKVYRKFVPVFARKAVKGEVVVTTINGKKATEYKVPDDNSWIVQGQVANETYPIKAEKLHANYLTAKPEPIPQSRPDHSFLVANKFQQYRPRPTKRMYAHCIDQSDMDWFRQQDPSATTKTAEDAYFMAPWGSPNRIELGDYMVLEYPDGKDDIYRIEKTLFKGSYKGIHEGASMEQQADNLREQTAALEERMAQYSARNPDFVSLESDIRSHLQSMMAALERSDQTRREAA